MELENMHRGMISMEFSLHEWSNMQTSVVDLHLFVGGEAEAWTDMGGPLHNQQQIDSRIQQPKRKLWIDSGEPNEPIQLGVRAL